MSFLKKMKWIKKEKKQKNNSKNEEIDEILKKTRDKHNFILYFITIFYVQRIIKLLFYE